MPSRTVTLEDRVAVIPTIFDQAQTSVANHPKNFVALYKNQAEAAKFTESLNHGKNIKLVGEKAFQDTIVDALNRVLPVKKGVQPADRIVKFVGGYIKFMNEKCESCIFGQPFGFCPLATLVDHSCRADLAM